MAINNNLVRRSSPSIFYKEKDITEMIKPYFKSFKVTDNLEGVFDEVNLQFDNKDDIFLRNNWALEKKEKIKIGVRTLNWENDFEGLIEKEIGSFYIDIRKFSKTSLTIKAISAPLNAKNQKNSKIWNKITLQRLGEEIAKKYKLEYFYKSNQEILLTNIKQEDKTDFSFLNEIASNEGLKLKVTHSKLVLFEEEILLKQEAKKTFDIKYFTDYEIVDKTDEIYDAIEITYFNSKKNKEEKAIITKEEIETGKTNKNKSYEKIYKLKKRAKSGDLKTLAKNILKRENRREIEIEWKMIGMREIFAGQVVNIIAGTFSGEYLITYVEHTMPRFTTSVKAYKIIGDYKEEENV